MAPLQVKAAPIPHLIKCIMCNRVKSHAAFNAKNLQILTQRIKNEGFDARNEGVVVCISCAPKQVTELQCSQCDKWKGLDKFSKTQRRERDGAKCLACIKEQVEMAPSGHSDGEDESGSGGEDSEAYYSGGEGTASKWSGTQTATTTGVASRSGAIWTGRSGASVAQTLLTAPSTVIQPSRAASVVSSAAGGVSLASARQQVTAPPEAPVECGRYISDSESEDYDDDSDEQDSWLDRGTRIRLGGPEADLE